jgi:hypothetical protein
MLHSQQFAMPPTPDGEGGKAMHGWFRCGWLYAGFRFVVLQRHVRKCFQTVDISGKLTGKTVAGLILYCLHKTSGSFLFKTQNLFFFQKNFENRCFL